MFSRKYKDTELCCGHNILTEGVFVTELSGNAGISVSRIVWVTTNCCFNILTEGVFVTELSGNAGISVSRIVWVTTNSCYMSDILISFLECLTDMVFHWNIAT